MLHAMFITRECHSPPITGYHIGCVHDELHGVVGVEEHHCFGMVGTCMITLDQLATFETEQVNLSMPVYLFRTLGLFVCRP